MSQHRFTVKHADHSIFVMAGWDRLNNVGNRMVVYEVPGAEAQPASPS